ncbi:glycosyltransferase family 39 protein [Anaeromyxobacter sp. SG17]|uniref:glycosyltransferase family 39 protein n=1 Tax=Anaeromyxobacter sp. SG17 TaxID=2925405 RepID=UPI001F593E11|nr:glycosyltransferase family 39 protein [Anaeromyxobacter sp. SG17]
MNSGIGRVLLRWAPGATIAATFLGMLALSWGKWPDVLVDFGHELYAAWRLSEGQALGRDIQWGATGPLPPYVNAAVFRIFGPELRALVVFNLLLLALLTWLLYSLIRALSDGSTATLACVAFLSIFGFGQYVGIGNYNYVTPYSHGVTHGLMLSLLAIWLFHRFATGGDRRHLGAAGIAVGLAFLTKPELFVACVAAVGVSWLAFAREVRSTRRAFPALAVLLGAACVPPVVAFALLLLKLPARDALHVTLAPWALMATPLTKTPFYLAGVGLDAPAVNLAALARWAGGYVLVAGLGVAAALAAHRLRLSSFVWSVGAFALTVAGLTSLVPPWHWLDVARPLPLFVLFGAAAYAWRAFRGPPGEARTSASSLGFALATFALALLGKMLLNARIIHYGFALAMPASLLAIVWFTWSAPKLLESRGLRGGVFRGVATGFLAVIALAYVQRASNLFATKKVQVGTGASAFVADDRGRFVAEMVRRIEQRAAPGDTLAVIPEGVMINFLTHHSSPSPYLTYLPDAIAAFGEAAMLEALRHAPPDLVLVVSRDASEHGARTFGIDYAGDTLQWLRQNYAPLTVVGGSPFNPDQYGMMLLARTSPSRSARAGP